jgi:hypothetical protein
VAAATGGVMSTKKKGMLTTSKEWAKHLRKFWKRKFWKSERRATRDTLQKSND